MTGLLPTAADSYSYAAWGIIAGLVLITLSLIAVLAWERYRSILDKGLHRAFSTDDAEKRG